MEDYKCALLLNNLGVSLMERGCYQQAMTTLRDAMAAINSVMTAGSDDNNDSSRSSVKKWMKRASKRSARAQPQAKPSPRLQTITYEDGLIPLLCLHDGTSEDCYSVTGCLRATAIDVPDCLSEEYLNERDVDLDIILLLSNFGLAYYLMASTQTTTSSPEITKKLVDNANSVFEIAVANVADRFGSLDEEDEIMRATLLEISLLITGNVSQIKLEMGQTSDARACYEKYHKIREALQDGCPLASEFSGMRRNHAAAAA